MNLFQDLFGNIFVVVDDVAIYNEVIMVTDFPNLARSAGSSHESAHLDKVAYVYL